MPETPAGHVVLVGMMGSGKTTVGRRVARRLDVECVDTDDALVTAGGRTIAEWFSEVGEDGFRDAEADVVAEVLAAPVTQVVATGGGVVERAGTRALLCDPRHRVVWLRAGPAFLASRIAQKAERRNRPLLGDDPAEALTRIDAARRDRYAEVADVVVDIEPVMTGAEHPRRQLAQMIVDVLARTGFVVQR